MTAAEMLLAGAGAASIVAGATDRRAVLRGAGAAAGVLGALAWRGSGTAGVLGAIAAAIAALNLFQLGLIALARGRDRFSVEEEAMRAHALHALDRAQARHLLDQGMWLDAKAGEVLIREQEPVSHLFYLAAGSADVTIGGTWIVATRAPTFLGEITVLDESGATATVTLAAPSRFWCVPAGELRLFLRENPAVRTALEHGFVGALAEKLRHANRRAMVEGAPSSPR